MEMTFKELSENDKIEIVGGERALGRWPSTTIFWTITSMELKWILRSRGVEA